MSSTRRCACRAQVARSQLRALDARPAPAYEHQHPHLHPLLAGSCTRTHTRTRTGWAVHWTKRNALLGELLAHYRL
jgi:hypothetical protein